MDVQGGGMEEEEEVKVQVRRYGGSLMASVRDRLGDAATNGPILQELTPVALDLERIEGRDRPRDVERVSEEERRDGCRLKEGSVKIKHAIMVPFAILMLVGAILIITVQQIFTRKIADKYETSCDASTETLLSDAILFELDAAANSQSALLKTLVTGAEETYISDSFQVVAGLFNLFKALELANVDAELLRNSIEDFLFLQLNSTFLQDTSGASILYTSRPRNENALNASGLEFLAYLFDNADSESSGLAWELFNPSSNASQIGQELTICDLDRLTGAAFDCESNEDDSVGYAFEGILSQVNVALSNPDSPSVGTWTNLVQVATSGRIPFDAVYGFLFSFPINICGNYSCFEGVISCNMATKVLSKTAARDLSVFQNIESRDSSSFLDCPRCTYFYVVAEPINTVFNGLGDQTGLIVAGAANGVPLETNSSSFAVNYSQNEQIQTLSQVLLKEYGGFSSWMTNGSIFVDFERKTLCNIPDRGEKLSADDFDYIINNCVVVAATQVLGTSPDPSFPISVPFQWSAVLSLPASLVVSDYASPLNVTKQQLDEIRRESDADVRKLAVISVVIAVLLIIGTLAFSYCLASLISRPIKRLEQDIKQLEKLDFNMKLHEGHRSAIIEVSLAQRAFLSMYMALETFSRFVPATVVRNIVKSEKGRQLNVTERVVTIMFSDIQGFTSIAEKLERVDLMYLITRYLTAMTTIVESYEGVVAEIQGDGLLAFWNTPDNVEEHQAKALAAAIAQQQYLRYLSVEFEREFRGKYVLNEFKVRIGIHTGTVLTGTIGSNLKMKFGCMGDAVNLASRLEGLSKLYGTQIICSEDTLEGCAHAADFLLRELDLVQVQGKTIPKRIFEVIAQRNPIEVEFSSQDIPEKAFLQKQSGHTKFIGFAHSAFDHVSQRKPSQKALKDLADTSSSLKKFHPLKDPRFDLEATEKRVKQFEKALHFFQKGKFFDAKQVLDSFGFVQDVAEQLLSSRVADELTKHNGNDVDFSGTPDWDGVNHLASKSY